MRIVSSLVLVLFLIVSLAPKVQAAEESLQGVFKDSFYGGLVGALIGGALLVFKDDRSEHYEMIGYGAAVGVIAGAVYGLTRAGRSLAEIEDGKMVVRVPAFRVESRRSVSGQKHSIMKSNLVTFHF